MWGCVWGCVHNVHVPVWLGFSYLGVLWELKSNYNQTWVKDAEGIPSYVNEVKGHLELFYVSSHDIGVQVSWSPITIALDL